MTNESVITCADLKPVIGQITDKVQGPWPADSVIALQKSFIKERCGTSMMNEDKRETLFYYF